MEDLIFYIIASIPIIAMLIFFFLTIKHKIEFPSVSETKRDKKSKVRFPLGPG